MNPDRFDILSKTFANNVSRRSALLGGGTGIAAALLAFTGLRKSDAAQVNSTNWYSVIRRYQLTNATIGGIEQQLRTGFMPMISQAPGFVEYMVVASPDNVLTTVTVFANQTQLTTAD